MALYSMDSKEYSERITFRWVTLGGNMCFLKIVDNDGVRHEAVQMNDETVVQNRVLAYLERVTGYQKNIGKQWHLHN